MSYSVWRAYGYERSAITCEMGILPYGIFTVYLQSGRCTRGRSTADSGVAEVQITRRHRVSTSTTFAVPDSSFRLLSLVDFPPFPSLLESLHSPTMSASKAQSQKIFEKLKLKPANKVRNQHPASVCPYCGLFWLLFANGLFASSCALTVAPRIRLGRLFPSVSTSASIARPITATLVFISPLFDPQTSTVCISSRVVI